MTAKTINRVTVPGATLHYEVTGDGPVLLLISGGGTDAAVYDGVVPQLAAQYTVVTYDPRGNSRSPLAGEPVDERIDVAAEDALAVLDAVASGDSAYVFGSSSGAITGLELLIRHPNRIRLLVAHEPPAAELLPDPEPARAFYAHKLLPFTGYRPDVGALLELEDKLVPAVGSESSAVLPAEPILALSERVGWDVVAFPGGHGGYAERPFEFATLLLKVLAKGGLR